MRVEKATDKLTQDIILLEAKSKAEFLELKKHVHDVYESLRPINLIKSAFNDVTHSPEIKEGIAKTAFGLASGFLMKKLMFKSSSNPLKKLAGAAFQTIVTNIATKNSEQIKDSGSSILGFIKKLVAPKKTT